MARVDPLKIGILGTREEEHAKFEILGFYVVKASFFLRGELVWGWGLVEGRREREFCYPS